MRSVRAAQCDTKTNSRNERGRGTEPLAVASSSVTLFFKASEITCQPFLCKGTPILYLPFLTFSNSSNLFSRARIRFGRSPSFLKTAIARQKALTSNAGVPTSI